MKKGKIGKKIAAWFMCLVMMLTVVNLPVFTVTAHAGQNLEIQNVSIDADGTVTWDAFGGAKKYNFNISTFNEIVEGTSCNLFEILENHGEKSGNYEIEFYAMNDDYIQISTKYVFNYSYTSRNPQLAAPENFVWNGTVISWDSVENATSYYVLVYKDAFMGVFIGSPRTVTENKIDITDYLREGTNPYGILVYAKADGYPNSEWVESSFKSITKELPSLTGVSIDSNGIMTWNAFPGAEQYEISASGCSNIVEGTSVNLKEFFKSYGIHSGEYDVTLKALDSSYIQISKSWNGAYSYTAPAPLNAPTNLVWSDKTVTWDSVANANSYRVMLYRDNYFSVPVAVITTSETSFEVPIKYLVEGTNAYGVRIAAFSDEYPSSEYAESELHQITYLKQSIQNAKINDGILSWDLLTGAKDYVVQISTDDIGITYTEATSFDVDDILKSNNKPSGEYSITLYARDSKGNTISTITVINYTYVIKCDIHEFIKKDDQYHQCLVCGQTEKHDLSKNITKATLTTDGKIEKTCKICGKVDSTIVIYHPQTITLSETSFKYDGTVKKPTVKVVDSIGNTIASSNYTVSYENGSGTTVNPVDKGTYKVKVVFKGNYSGTKYISFTIGDEAGKWIKSNGKWWYRHADGTYTKNGWEKIDGKWYHFDASGYMQTGWQKISNKWYYFDASGVMLTGWQKVGTKWYRFDSTGAMLTGWQKVGTKWYYFEGSGAMLTGWQKLSNKWYYFNTSGAMLTGWQEINSKWYYFDASGVMQSASWISKVYYMDATGAMVTSAYIKDGSKYYWVDKNGKYTKTYSEKDTKGYTIYDQATGKKIS